MGTRWEGEVEGLSKDRTESPSQAPFTIVRADRYWLLASGKSPLNQQGPSEARTGTV